jgi:hypothetical protein
VARGGGPAACTVERLAWRLWGLASMRGCALWGCHERAGVLDRAEGRQRDGGGPGCFSLFLPGLTAGVWAGETGGPTEERQGHCLEVRD